MIDQTNPRPDRKTYGLMTTAERWVWHTETYAFRQVALGISVDEHQSPCDPEGRWYDETLVRSAAARLRGKREAEFRRRQRRPDYEEIGAGKQIANAWARANGYADFAQAEADGRGYAEVCRAILNTGPPQLRQTAR